MGGRPAFEETLAAVERGKEELVAAVPSPRGVPPRPLADALLGFETALGDAARTMAEWRNPETEANWGRCRLALAEALRRAERLRLAAPPLDYEGVVTVIGDLIAPLDAFADVDRRLSG